MPFSQQYPSLFKIVHKKQVSVANVMSQAPLAKIVWRIVRMAFNIIPPTNVTNLFGNWLAWVEKKEKVQIQFGVCALVWAIWNIRNDYILTT
jgi:MFS-type transporter involved in bile tolerance (Atg22 family)